MISIHTSVPRRVPRQRRSQERVARIVQAAGALLEENGYAQLTTNAIASRAGTSIGSLYQFFPNKEAVVAELVAQYRRELHAFLHQGLSVALVRESIPAVVEIVVDGIEALRERSPGFGSILWLRSVEGSPSLTAIALDRDILDPLEKLLAEAYPDVPMERRHRCMVVVGETTKALLSRVSRETPFVQAQMRQELKRMLGLYLSSYFQAAARSA